MSGQISSSEDPVRGQPHVEAAAWVVRLHGPARTRQMEAGLRQWLAESPEHAHAFELATETWDASAQARQPVAGRIRRWWAEQPSRIGLLGAAAAGAVLTATVVAVVFLFRDPVVLTAIGEQRTLTLVDGTRVSLNTDSRLLVDYNEQTRRVQLERGEALFEVAKRPNWPFVVDAGERTIQAVGTAFVVRREGSHIAVTLVEGKVSVAVPAANPARAAVSEQRGDERATTQADTVTLAPGDRLTVDDRHRSALDRPALERVTAWRRGLVMLDHTTLAEAVAEMNRYSHVKIALADTAAGTYEVSGIFRIGESMRFARAVAHTYDLIVIEQPEQIVLSSVPAAEIR